jgi:hypothetical protein
MNCLHSHNVCDDWGWFVDTETNKHTHLIQLDNYKKEKNVFDSIYLLKIIDEYEYYNEMLKKKIKKIKKIKKNKKNFILIACFITLTIVLIVYILIHIFIFC